MTVQRFVLDRNENVIDTLDMNPTVVHFAMYETSEKSLRESVLIRQTNKFVDKLFVNNNPVENDPWLGSYQIQNPENWSMTTMIYHTVKASELNKRDISMSVSHKFDGRLCRDDEGWQSITSLFLFVNDIDCLLRNLYGDFDEEAIQVARQAVFVIANEFLRFVRKDLWLEHQAAKDIDYCCGIGLTEELGISGEDHRASCRGVAYLFDRVSLFRANPNSFSQYTAQLVKGLEAHPTIFKNEMIRRRDDYACAQSMTWRGNVVPPP